MKSDTDIKEQLSNTFGDPEKYRKVLDQIINRITAKYGISVIANTFNPDSFHGFSVQVNGVEVIIHVSYDPVFTKIEHVNQAQKSNQEERNDPYYSNFIRKEKLRDGLCPAWLVGNETPEDFTVRFVSYIIDQLRIPDSTILAKRLGQHLIDSINSDPIKYVNGEPNLLVALKTASNYTVDTINGYNEAVKRYAKGLI